MKRNIAAASVALIVATTGCAYLNAAGPPSLEKDRQTIEADLDLMPPFPIPTPTAGSLWSDSGPGAALLRDARAYRLNDLVRIRLAEASLGTNGSSTSLNRTSSAAFGAPVVGGLEDPNAQPGSFNLANVLTTSTDSKHSGDGTTSRSTTLVGYVTARVVRVLPNGDLVVLTLVGSVRPVDISSSNEVVSSAVGDLTVRLWGRGEVDGTIREGWFMKIMKRIWPF
jgi:flagellar L-ring protein precursor FlgH